MLRKLFDRLEGRRLAVLAIATVGTLCVAGGGVFGGATQTELDRSLWSLLLSDRSTLGFIRAAIIGLAIYAIASVAALIASGRWIRSFRSTGFEADSLRDEEDARRAKQDAISARRERDEAMRLLREHLDG